MKRVMAAVLAALVLLSGCGKWQETAAGLYDKASGVASDAVLLTVNGKEVPAARYFYWLTADCDYLAEQSGGQPDWSADAGGESIDAYVRAQALSATVFYAVVEALAEEQGCVVTAGDLAAMDADWTAQAEAAGGEDAYLAALARRGLDQAGAQLFSADYYLYEHLRELSRTEGSDLAPKAGEVEDYAAELGLYTAEVLAFESEDQAAVALSELEKDPSLPPSALKDGTYAVVTAAPGDGTLPAAGETALAALEPGKWSQIVEAGGTECLLLRPVALDMDAALDLWFDRQMERRAETAEVVLSEAYGSFTTASFYQGLTAARQAES